MGSISAALNTAGSALDVIGQAMCVIQNNVANASTPGYVTQTLELSASPFDASQNLWGGVTSAGVQSSRDVYAEQAVWTANQQVGQSTQEASSLNSLQSSFDVSGTSGIPAALSSLYAAFSAWSANPTDTASRQQVLTAATTLSQSFNQTASNISQLSSQTDQQISGTVSQINSLTSQIASINGEIQNGDRQDAGVQTQLYNALEQLSNLAPISVQTASDGTATVLLGGQSPLVLGSEQHQLSVASGGTPDAQLLNDQGQDVTYLASQGQLGGLLNFRNQTIPSVIGDSQQQGSLNQLAQSIADTVNNTLTAGQVSAGPPVVSGIPLFSYSASSPAGVASSLSLSSSISASTLAAIAPGPPSVANGTASALADLSTSNEINNVTYTGFYSGVAADIGQQQSNAAANQTTQSQLLAQAQNLRDQVSGVSLNQQATLLMQYQESYQAAAQLISVITTTTQDLLTTMQGIH